MNIFWQAESLTLSEDSDSQHERGYQPSKIKVLINIRRVDVGTDTYCFEIGGVTTLQKSLSYSMIDWLGEDLDNILANIRQVQNLKEGQACTLYLVLKPWSHKYDSYCGTEYDSGFDLCKVRTLRKSKIRSGKYRY